MGKIDINAIYEKRLLEIEDDDIDSPGGEIPEDHVIIDTLTDKAVQKKFNLTWLIEDEVEPLLIEYDTLLNSQDEYTRNNVFKEMNILNTLSEKANQEIEEYFTENFTIFKPAEISVSKGWMLTYPKNLIGKEDWREEFGIYDESDPNLDKKEDVVGKKKGMVHKADMFILDTNNGPEVTELVVINESDSSDDRRMAENLARSMSDLEGESQN